MEPSQEELEQEAITILTEMMRNSVLKRQHYSRPVSAITPMAVLQELILERFSLRPSQIDFEAGSAVIENISISLLDAYFGRDGWCAQVMTKLPDHSYIPYLCRHYRAVQQYIPRNLGMWWIPEETGEYINEPRLIINRTGTHGDIRTVLQTLQGMNVADIPLTLTLKVEIVHGMALVNVYFDELLYRACTIKLRESFEP